MTERDIIEETRIIREYVQSLTKEDAIRIMIEAGIINKDGTLTDPYKPSGVGAK